MSYRSRAGVYRGDGVEPKGELALDERKFAKNDLKVLSKEPQLDLYFQRIKFVNLDALIRHTPLILLRGTLLTPRSARTSLPFGSAFQSRTMSHLIY